MKNEYKRILDDDDKEIIEAIAKAILEEIKEERKKELKEGINLLDEITQKIIGIDEKSKSFFMNKELCTAENLKKLYDLLDEEERFYDEILKNK